MSKSKTIELSVDILPIPESGRLKAKQVLDWMESDLFALQRYVSDAMSVSSSSRTDTALSYLVYEIGCAIEACAQSLRSESPIRFVGSHKAADGDWLSWTADLGRIVETLPDIPMCDSTQRGHQLIAGELVRRLTAFEEARTAARSAEESVDEMPA